MAQGPSRNLTQSIRLRNDNEASLAKNRQTPGAYQGGLQTNFTGTSDTVGVGGRTTTGATSNDSDVTAMQGLMNEDAQARAGKNDGVDFGHNAALENMYSTRIGLKNSLAEQIGASSGLLNQEQDTNKLAAGSAIGEGLKNTRNNYNSRGLLYSGAREGGEQKVRSQGASQLAATMAATTRDSENSTNKAKAAYAAVDFANQQDTLNRANQAFDTANANNIARLQAFQQLGQGVGDAAGSIAGSYYENEEKKNKSGTGGTGLIAQQPHPG